MSKLFIKLFIVTSVFMGFCVFFSSGSKVAAAGGVNCPQNQYVPDNWGTNAQDGPMDHGFAAVAVHAYYVDAQGYHDLDIKYHLVSSLDHGPPGNPTYNIPGEVGNPDARIFQMPIPGGGRYNERWFGTGGRVDQLHAGPGPTNAGYCPGWDELGVGTASAVGNTFLLDCQEIDTAGIKRNNHFWIDDITTPQDPIARYGGHWKIEYSSGGVGLRNITPPMSYTNDFEVVNGDNARINLEWIPNEPPKTPDIKAECTEANITDGGGATINGKHFESGAIRTSVRVYDSSGHVMVHESGNQNNFIYFNDTTRHWNYSPPLGKFVTVQVYRQYYHQNGRDWLWSNIPNGSLDGSGQPYQFTNGEAGNQTRTHDCYNNVCSIYVESNVAGDPNGVKAGQTMNVYVTLTNTAGIPGWDGQGIDIPGNLNGTNWYFYSDGYQSPGLGGIAYQLPTLARASSMTFGTQIRAPDRGGIYTFSGSAVFPGMFYTQNPGTNCTYSFDVYQEFSASLSANTTLSPDTESPTAADYSTTVNVSPSSPSVYIPTTSIFCKQPTGTNQQTCNNPPSSGQQNIATNNGGTYPGSWSGKYNIPSGSFNAGDRFCTIIYAGYRHGWIGPHGEIAETSDPGSSIPNCGKIVNQPYAHIFGSDVVAGGGFGACTTKTSNGSIYAYNKKPSDSNKGGSSAQFGAHAMDVISGLGSASLRSSSPTGLSGLSFANTEHVGGGAPSPTTGGYLGDAALSNFCMPDYFSDKPSDLTAQDTNPTATAAGGAAKQWRKPSGGTLTLHGGTIPNKLNQAIFVEGNVYIDGDIKFDPGSRGSVKDIPSFFLVVKNGNIRIAPNVKQLDGVYIAQPDTTNNTTINRTGIINTCYVGNDTNTIFDLCKEQLVVNGAFVANRVLLVRSHSSIRYSLNGESIMSGATRSCGNPGKDVPIGAPNKRDCAAEIFNFTPEIYMTQPNINVRFGPLSGKYDSFTSLSPVL